RPWDSHVCKVQTTIINTVQAAFEAIVFTTDTGQEITVVIAQRHKESVNTIIDVLRDQLSKHYCGFTVFGGVAEEFFPSSSKRCVDLKLVVFRDEGSRGIDVAHVRTMTNLRHCIYTGEFKTEDTRKPTLMLFLITQG